MAGGYEIYRWNGANWTYQQGGAVRIAVNSSGFPSIVNHKGEIYQLSLSGTWMRLPGAATDIAFDGEGYLYILGTYPTPGGYSIYKQQGNGWYQLPGGAIALSIGPKGTPWVVSNDGGIFKGLGLALTDWLF